MATKEKSTFSHFFKENAEQVQSIVTNKNGRDNSKKTGIMGKEEFPKLKQPKEISEEDFKSQWQSLRSFFRNGNNTEGLSADLAPVIMAPLYTGALVGADFPVWVADETFDGDGPSCLSLKDLLTQSCDSITSEENGANILAENIGRILHIATQRMSDGNPRLFQSEIERILEDAEKQIEVSGDDLAGFNMSLVELAKILPKNGALLPYSNSTSFQVLEAAMVCQTVKSRSTLKNDIAGVKSHLADLLRVDLEKGPERKKPERLKDQLAFVDTMMNFKKITSIIPGGGGESLGKERVQRITNIVKELGRSEALLEQQGFFFVDELIHKNKDFDWKHLFGNTELVAYKKGKGCDAIRATFDEQIASWTKLFVALRMGTLELQGYYQADVHDDFFEHFTWKNLTTEELSGCPPFVMLANDDQLFANEINQLNAILSDNLPVRIVTVKQDENTKGSTEDVLSSKSDLRGLMMSHNNVFVYQSTSITPVNLYNGFMEGLSTFAPAIFSISYADINTHANAYLSTSSTIESRDFPGFTFRGLLGTPWGSRFDVQNNPQCESAWPIHKITIENAEGEKEEVDFPYTFADQASLDPANHSYFSQVDSSLWSDNLIPLSDFLGRSEEENIGCVPTIWMLNSANELIKVAVAWPMILATQERLDFWKFLQENSGINNYHVGAAIDDARANIQEELNLEIEQLKEEQQKEIQSIRDEEAGKVMENLSAVLLNMDTSNVVAAPTASSAAPTVTTSEETETSDEPQEEVKEEASVLSNDPYIDTALCTSCNDCLDLNGQMFKYNGDKMAFIADATAGTFSELVDAAEKCPVSIIHPGSPLNPDEPGLDSLIEQAEQYN
ncbi:MAG: ferredoxin [Cytophagales bacterium]|nr:ferredoxin [Cytophagales bacterium]